MKYTFTFLILLSGLFATFTDSFITYAQVCGDMDNVCDYLVADSTNTDNLLTTSLQNPDYIAFRGSAADEILDWCRFSFGIDCSNQTPMDYDLDQNIVEPAQSNPTWKPCTFNPNVNCLVEPIATEGDPNFIGTYNQTNGPFEREYVNECAKSIFDTECLDIFVPAPFTTSLEYKCGNDGKSLNKSIISDKDCKKEFEKNNPQFNYRAPVSIPVQKNFEEILVPAPKTDIVPIFVPRPKTDFIAPEEGLASEEYAFENEITNSNFSVDQFSPIAFDNN